MKNLKNLLEIVIYNYLVSNKKIMETLIYIYLFVFQDNLDIHSLCHHDAECMVNAQ